MIYDRLRLAGKILIFFQTFSVNLTYIPGIKVTHNTCNLHLVSNFQNSSKHTKPSIENSTSLWLKPY